MCNGSELTVWWMFMMAYWSCEVSPALLNCPSWAREREGAYPCREEVCLVQQGTDGSHSGPKRICEKWNHWVDVIFREKKCDCNNSLFGDWCIIQLWFIHFLFLLWFLTGAEDVRCWSVSPSGVWMGGGVLCGEESRIEVKTGEPSLLTCHIVGPMESVVKFVFNPAHR